MQKHLPTNSIAKMSFGSGFSLKPQAPNETKKRRKKHIVELKEYKSEFDAANLMKSRLIGNLF